MHPISLPTAAPLPADGVRRRVVAVIAVTALALAGCFDGATLLEAKQEETKLVRLDEIDLGEFRITLPGAAEATNGGVVEFHAFGQVAVRDHGHVVESLQQNGPKFRNGLLMVVRSMSEQDLDDPQLHRLRMEVANLANASLKHKSVTNVGFYRFAFAAGHAAPVPAAAPASPAVADDHH